MICVPTYSLDSIALALLSIREDITRVWQTWRCRE